MTMRTRITLIVTVASLAASLIALIAVAQTKLDRVVNRDGTTVAGHVKSVDETNVLLDGSAIPRSEVKAILFAGTKSTPAPPSSSGTQPPGTNLTDLIVKRIGGSSYGHVSQVTESLVIQNGKQLPRKSVASIQFNVNNPGEVITVYPSPSPPPSASASASPSSSPRPSTSPDSGGGGGQPEGGAAGGKGNQPSGGAGSQPPQEKPLPPWFGDDPHSTNWCPDHDWTEVTIRSNASPAVNPNVNVGDVLNCLVTIFACGDHSKMIGPYERGDVDCTQFGHLPNDKRLFLCCSRLNKSKNLPGIHCDGTKDIDCDGQNNDVDDFPFDPNCWDRNAKCADKYKNKP